MHTTYTGERVRLRPFASAEQYTALDDRLMEQPNPYWGPHWRPLAERQAEFAATGVVDPGSYSAFAIENLDSGIVIGLEEHGPVIPGKLWTWLGTHLLTAYQGRGLGTEAKRLILCHLFECFPLEAVYAVTLEQHQPALASLARTGFHRAGRLRGMAVSQGGFADEAHYVIFREEWLEQGYWRKVKRGN